MNEMKGKTVLITGTASGMGRIAAKRLAEMGAALILVDFDVENGEAARDEIIADTGNTNLEFIDCDVTSFSQVRKMAEYVNTNYPCLDVLINNAGITESVRRESVEGFEMTMATNFIAPFLITHLLLEKLKASAPARIVNIASDAHKMAKTLDFEDIDNREGWEKVHHGKGFQAYARSKLSLCCFSYQLAEKLAGSGVDVYCVSPGYFIRTNVVRHMRGIWKLGVTLFRPFMVDPNRPAETYVYVASAPDVAGQTGKYWEYNALKESSEASHDKDLQARIWEYAERATGLEPIG
jgi:NAD(P)-dependent dehydrogenase (short-subunit alcohol dehydrogenase family)